MRPALLFVLACACRTAPSPEARYLEAIRQEARALDRAEGLLAWTVGTQGRDASQPISSLAHDRLAELRAVARAEEAASGDEARALRLLQRDLIRRWIGRRLAPFDEAVAQSAAREAGFADYVAYCEWDQEVDLRELLASGIVYLEATEAIFRSTLDRVAREELGLPRESLRSADWARLWASPRLSPFFPRDRQLGALRAFLGGLGLDLRTAAGTEIRIDGEPRAFKRQRAFVAAVDPPRDVRLSLVLSEGLDGLSTLFHEAGHALQAANAAQDLWELRALRHGAPTEAYGEFFRDAFSDPRWLVRYRELLRREGRPLPGNAELAAIARRTALAEMAFIRRYAFARVAFELRLHGRPASEIAPALALLPDPERARGDLRELYRQLLSVASGFEPGDAGAQAWREVDEGCDAAGYARGFVLAGLIHEGIRRRFGEDWYGNPAVGAFLRERLFRSGGALGADEVAHRVGFERLDFSLAASRAARLVAEADALEKAK